MKFGFDWPSKMFENNGHIHSFSPGAAADNPLGYFVFNKHNYLVNFVLCCKFSP